MKISNLHVPVFIPFGYTGIGKTMLMQRLVRYVHDNRLGTCTTFDNETILLRVHDRGGGKEFCFLDLSGSRFEDTYVKKQLSLAPNPKIWGFMVEYGTHQHVSDRNDYIKLVHSYVSDVLKSNDKVFFICNKMDQVVNRQTYREQIYIFKRVKDEYPGIFTPFENKNPFTRLFKKYNCRFVPFSSGYFHRTETGEQCYVPSEDVYPKMLWEAIYYSIK
jgi:hypothetical protein